MKNPLINLGLCLLIILQTIPITAQENQSFDTLFSRWNDSQILQPGISLAIIKNQEVVYKNSSGYANLEYQIPLDHRSVFDIASLAKQFTGFAIASLIHEKKLTLEEPIIQYLPELALLDKGLRIKHLLHHTSGLRDIGELFDLAYSGENFTAKEALAIIKNQRALNFPVGSEYDYSNTNYVLLALIVERISGKTFREWCDENIFSPLNMKHTFVNDNPYEIIENRAVAYNASSPTFSFQQNNGMALIGSSAVYSTLNDMIIWVQALQNETLFPEVFRLMKQKGKLNNGEEITYGFGLGIDHLRNEAMIEHTGATPSGFRTAMAIFPDQSLAVVVLSNWGELNPIGDFGIHIINHYLPKPEPKQEVSPTAKTVFTLSKEVASRYTGHYLFNGEMKVKIRLNEQDDLMVELEGQPENSLIPISETEFDFPAAASTLHFMSDGTGKYNKVEVRVNGQMEGELSRIKTEAKAPLDNSQYTGFFYSDELKIVFEIGVSDNQLILRNSKRGEVKLTNKADKIYIPEQGIASSLVFENNQMGEVTGFLLNRGSRVRKLKFVKIAIN